MSALNFTTKCLSINHVQQYEKELVKEHIKMRITGSLRKKLKNRTVRICKRDCKRRWKQVCMETKVLSEEIKCSYLKGT